MSAADLEFTESTHPAPPSEGPPPAPGAAAPPARDASGEHHHQRPQAQGSGPSQGNSQGGKWKRRRWRHRRRGGQDFQGGQAPPSGQGQPPGDREGMASAGGQPHAPAGGGQVQSDGGSRRRRRRGKFRHRQGHDQGGGGGGGQPGPHGGHPKGGSFQGPQQGGHPGGGRHHRGNSGWKHGKPWHRHQRQAEEFQGESPPVQVLTEPSPAAGVLEVHEDGSGFLRRIEYDYAERPDDIFVPAALVRKFKIQEGSSLEGLAVPTQQRGHRIALNDITRIDGYALGSPELEGRIPFKDLTSLDPIEKFELARNARDPSVRLLDLLTPIGKGQRGLIVAPPRTGKTMLLQRVAHSITENHPEVHLIVLLVDERPEEATDWKRSVRSGEVLSSTSDEMAARHVNIAEIVIERAKRLVELKRDVVILFDSLTRLARAYNLQTKNSGRTLSGGVDARTLEKPKAFFGAARKAEEGGSLTILATALIETGSRMDQVIFEEFKGTGNMELVLSRKLADLRIFPAIDFNLSGTRKEEKLIAEQPLRSIWALRRVLQKVDQVEGMKILIKKISESASNEEFLGSFKPVD